MCPVAVPWVFFLSFAILVEVSGKPLCMCYLYVCVFVLVVIEVNLVDKQVLSKALLERYSMNLGLSEILLRY